MVQIAKTASLGLYRVWASTESWPWSAPTSIASSWSCPGSYVNQKTAKEAAEVRLVRKFSKLLPRSNTVYYLNEYNVTETVFR